MSRVESMTARGRRRVSGGMVAVTATALLGAAIVAPATAASDDETGTVRGGQSPNAVAGEYIVVLDDAARSASAVRTASRSLAKEYDADVSTTYDSALHGFAAAMSAQDAKKMAADDRVAYVQANQELRAWQTQPDPTWGLDRVDQQQLPLDESYTYDTDAANVNAYIIDTGIDVSHPDLEGRAQVGTDTVGDGKEGQDCNGHGTHVAGTVGSETYGLAKEVNLYAVRVLDCEGSGTTEGVIQGIEWVTENAQGPAVANMSLGGPEDPALDQALQASIESGITYAVASGNENDDACNYSPARVEQAISTNASSDADARADFSNYGDCTDIFAPGVDVESTVPGGGTDTFSGTSMASPHVAGAAALYLSENPEATPADVEAALTDGATPDVITEPGDGSSNLLLFTGDE